MQNFHKLLKQDFPIYSQQAPAALYKVCTARVQKGLIIFQIIQYKLGGKLHLAPSAAKRQN
jgi:hypothetical protein